VIPYGRQSIDDEDIKAVVEVLRSAWLTTGPKVAEFEKSVADYVGAKFAMAVSNGTAALHSAMYALGIGQGDEVIVPPMTFVSTVNAIIFQGGSPVFADIDPNTMLIDPDVVKEKITKKTKAIIAVDFAGHPCDYDRLREIADQYGLVLVADGCHALGAEYKGQRVGSLADLTVFSFHPVKHITTGEGGMVVTDNLEFARRIRMFRNHGIASDFRQREEARNWYYEMVDLGYNYRMTDFQCALGISQLQKLPDFLERRHAVAALYEETLADISGIEPLGLRADVLPAEQFAEFPSPPYSMLSKHAYHLYVVRFDLKSLMCGRTVIFQKMRDNEIGVNVHYIPVHLHPFYREKLGTGAGLCPIAEEMYEEIMTLPIYPGMDEKAVKTVISAVLKVLDETRC